MLMVRSRARSRDLLEESLVEAEVIPQLRVERADGDRTLSAQHRTVPDRSQDLDAGPHPLHGGGPDEHGVQRAAGEAVDGEVGLEGVALPAERVAAHRDVDGAQ